MNSIRVEVDDARSVISVSIPVNVDPLATSGGANKAAADASAVSTRGPLPEPVGGSASDTSGGAPASDKGTAVTDDASAVPAAPPRVPLPRPRPVAQPVREKVGWPVRDPARESGWRGPNRRGSATRRAPSS